MRKLFGKALRIGLSHNGVTLLQMSGMLRPRIEILADQPCPPTTPSSLDLSIARLADILAEHKCTGLPATVILTDELVRLFMVTPPQNASRLADCMTAAEMRFRTLYGEASSDWQIESDWQPHRPFLACALPKSLIAALRGMASQHRLTLVEIIPQFIAAWNGWHAALDGSSWFGVAHENTLTIGAIQQKTLHAVRSTSAPAESWSDQEWLSSYIEREALRLNLPMPREIRLCGKQFERWPAKTAGTLLFSRLDAGLNDTGNMSAGLSLAHSGLRR